MTGCTTQKRKYLRPGIGHALHPVLSAVLLACCPAALAEDIVEFDPAFLNLKNPTRLDLTRFSRGAAALPGEHATDVWLNGEFISRETLTFRALPDGGSVICAPESLLLSLPLADGVLKPAGDTSCQDLSVRLPDATRDYDSGRQRLDLTLPQIMVRRTARGTVSPSQWDNGVTAAMLGYNLGAWRSESHGSESRQAYGNLNAGLNIGAWYFRHNGSFNWQNEQGHHYDTLNTWVQRDIPALRGRLLAGESNTRGQLFDTVPFTGVSLASDDRMLPESLRGYAPEIRGIARTNALVKISQNGQVIYETTVTPGEFVIDDLYPTGYGGSLDVLVQEADGQEQRFEVPYAAVTQLLRPGNWRYSLTGGKLRSEWLRDKPAFGELTWQQGLTNRLTGYGGVQLAPDYSATQGGVAVGTRIGAIAADVTHTDFSAPRGKKMQGQSWRLSYSKYLPETGSNFSLATYRFSTQHYLNIQDAMQLREQSVTPDNLIRPRNRATLTFNQVLGRHFGHLYLSGSVQNYWGRDGHDQQYQAGYNLSTGQLAWGLSVTRSRNNSGKFENTWLLSLNTPLGGNTSRHTPYLRAGLTRDAQGKAGEQLTLSGTAGQYQQFSYSADASHHETSGSAGTLSGQYRSPWSSLSATWSQGRHYNSASAGMNGTVVAHGGGVSFSPYTGDTFAVIEAKGAEGARVTSQPGIRVDSRGYALVPNLNPYQMNDVSIDPRGAQDGVEFSTTRQKVAPLSGAVVKLHYGVKQGNTLLLNLTQQNGQPVPFGAEVTDSSGAIAGYTGQAGQLYALVNQPAGTLTVKWGEGNNGQCRVTYRTSEQAASIQQHSATCR
ncbi:fimbrial biogenesis outer membrane usher protein [Enterobacter cloacae subsp. cloacae]|uniref:fimbria/pilus outer membrane usher protein n=1 Tax=Enterobacter cloacae TaxID=550 RepID=UPI001C5AD3EC|nr:fimbria/pilus outer membrane usher protein [Enterobacter cloacae]MBW4204108.1 fimbrial biogenesis outer membrane usher protein [Enterobacter cloacae subsp. cloacae]